MMAPRSKGAQSQTKVQIPPGAFSSKTSPTKFEGRNNGCWECYDVRSFLGILEHVLVPLPACGSNLKTGSSDAVTKCPSVLQTLQAITKLREGLVFCTKAPERQGAEPNGTAGSAYFRACLSWNHFPQVAEIYRFNEPVLSTRSLMGNDQLRSKPARPARVPSP